MLAFKPLRPVLIAAAALASLGSLAHASPIVTGEQNYYPGSLLLEGSAGEGSKLTLEGDAARILFGEIRGSAVDSKTTAFDDLVTTENKKSIPGLNANCTETIVKDRGQPGGSGSDAYSCVFSIPTDYQATPFSIENESQVGFFRKTAGSPLVVIFDGAAARKLYDNSTAPIQSNLEDNDYELYETYSREVAKGYGCDEVVVKTRYDLAAKPDDEYHCSVTVPFRP